MQLRYIYPIGQNLQNNSSNFNCLARLTNLGRRMYKGQKITVAERAIQAGSVMAASGLQPERGEFDSTLRSNIHHNGIQH